ncbi:D-alanyl-D-alanine carboxypeptidase [Patescibacteria group bacterium]|nr:D-alanyl-D-alanine carboxypeptidase [Patescibacteria group bacterium]MCL5409885.1 D-alanyl-D-alanine carboxypeptidase [Patescibacteria group bacterium]
MIKKLLITAPFLILLFFIVYPLFTTHAQEELISPWVSGGREMVNLWFPKQASDSTTGLSVNITAQSVYFIDIDSGQVLYQKNIHQRVRIASLTKIMTIIVALENHKFTDQISVSKYATQMEPDHMLLQEGEKLSLEELLDGMFLVSANDAAEAVAESVEGGRSRFIQLMNQKAQQLGMADTIFANPTGLDEDNIDEYSSAYDVALMSRYAITQFPHLLDISSQYHLYIPPTNTHQDYDLYSGINLLTTYPGVMGFKTGYTPDAGMTLVTYAQKGGHRVLGVILNSQDRRNEARALLDYSFQQLDVE